MYQGDLGIIGDPSVKPHDRVYMYDTYEDMMGMFEVEAVVHTLSASQGFTTSIMPDVIARHQDEMEPSSQGLLNTICSVLKVAVTSNIAHNLWSASVNNKLAVSLAKSNIMYGASKRLNDLAEGMSVSSGMSDYLDTHPTAKQLFENLNFMPSDENLKLNRFTYLIDDLAKGTLNTLDDSFDDFIKLFGKYNSFEPDEFAEMMMKAFKKDNYGLTSSHSEESIKAASDAMKLEFDKLQKSMNKNLDSIDLAKFVEDINDSEIEYDPKTKNLIDDVIAGKRTDKSKVLSELFQDDEIAKALKKGDKLKLNGMDELFNGFKNVINDDKIGFKSPSIIKALRGGDVIEDLMSVVIRAVKLN
ncbi:MAG: hypothetical protein RR406_00460 [Bacilli bacterium]